MNSVFKPKVSIVIPVYKGSNYLSRAIDSALNQTYDNLEIIVVDDGSIDNTRDIALSYGDKIRYFYKENGGSSSALNYGIKMMKGDYFSWLSHDDEYYEDKIEKQIDYLANYDNKECIVFSGSDLIDSNDNIIRKAKNLNEIENYVNSHSNEYFIAQPNRYYFSGCACLIPISILNKINGFDENLRLVNDFDLWFRIYSLNYKVLFVPESLVKSRMHSKQISRNTVYRHNTEEEIVFWNRTLDYLYDNYFDNKELFELFGECAYKQTFYDIGDRAFSLIDKRSLIKRTYIVLKSKVWMFMKNIYLKYWIDRK